ncbi:amidohydrolase 2 [Vararia minispora EC-137]|uniref:Amidohydrolase 2 n=1 Tax=Vararia minispora EC-137 TaxID=1314806 RepID=A0ACB8QVS6_9AGAM|nr:amidohydrolase 2 [Vararia minispora EC-137]
MLSTLTSLSLLLFLVNARVWNDTGDGSIVFEEAWTTPGLLFQSRFMVLSCASPCVQGLTDPDNATATATAINDELANLISNNTLRFGAFAALAMQDPVAAAAELNRTVTELGFLGALVNDYQEIGPSDNSKLQVTYLFYDQPEYDVFWQMVVDLDVPIYFHPRTNIPPVSTLMWSHSSFLRGPVQEFAVTLSSHILGLCVNGVFDRFPGLKVIVGHLGERVPSDIWRINDQLQRQLAFGMPMQQNVTAYLQKNIFETTSGNFATDLLQFHIDQIGESQILYSVDYPYVTMEQGEAWLENELPAVLHKDAILALKRGRAIELLGLNR